MFCGIDLGRSGCRLAVVDDRPLVVSSEGGASLIDAVDSEGAHSEVVTAALQAILTARDQLPAERRHPAGSLVCGVAGAGAEPELAAELATRLQAELPGTTVQVTSDLVITHAGALGGRSGSVANVGTGAEVIALSPGGELRQLGNWGPWLGDDGSGAWLGREALRRVLASREADYDLGPLVGAATERYGDLDRLHQTLATSGTPARSTAAFAGDVLRLAEDGEPGALEVTRSAADALASVLQRSGPGPYAITGGLSGHQVYLDEIAGALGQPVTNAEGTALDGALLLAGGTTTAPHLGLLIGAATRTPPESATS
ncbi:ATPase [Naumannella halotolerans]|uniref:ATPase n=1 Tax=Naumannella halotolerans TaxID=993414 RepID=UPI00105F63E5|nr:ATPase [Naumannella halotolerans]